MQGKTEEHFMDRIREWETASQQAYAVSRFKSFLGEVKGDCDNLSLRTLMTC